MLIPSTMPQLCTLAVARQACLCAALAAFAAALVGCQSVAGTPRYAQIRIVDASPDAGAVDVYQGPSAIAYNLGFGTVTSYIPITPGNYSFSIDAAGSTQQLSTARGFIALPGQYTLITGNVAASLQTTLIKDQATPAPSGQVAFRFLDQTTRTAAVDVYLLPAGAKLIAVAPTVTAIAFGANSGYVSVPSGSYTIVVLPTGTVPAGTTSPIYTGTQIAYASGAARTVVLLDQQVLTMPGLQAVVVDDYDSPAATN